MKRFGKLIVCALLLTSISACTNIGGSEQGAYYYQTLGIAHVEECRKFEGREDKVVEECFEISTDAFSAWKELTEGIANAIIKVITLGLL